MFDISTPKTSLYIATAYAGGTLTPAEQTEITSRGLLTDGQIAAMKPGLGALNTTFSWSHMSAPTGVGHLTFDIWLQSQPGQDSSFTGSSITHEIMIPLEAWGGYGVYPTRNPSWYDHDVTIGGRLYHVYCTKDLARDVLTGAFGGPVVPGLNYSFGGLDNTYGPGHWGWKLIVFEPDVLPMAATSLNIADFIAHVKTRVDSVSQPWCTGDEYIVSVELGVEPVEGTGDIVVSNFKVST
jgi:hypothetical protein